MGENGETKMATLNGQTPQQIAKEIVKDAVTPSLIEIDGVTSQHLDILVRKDHRDEIDTRGENFWRKNRDRVRQEYLTEMINGAHKQLIKYLEKREKEMNLKYYESLIKGGMSANDAHKLAFNGKETEPVTAS
jgi:sulfur relay (sulfurtransferase) DsrC/TusE family protein